MAKRPSDRRAAWAGNFGQGSNYARDGHVCVWCGVPRECLDHLRPRSMGGSNKPRNLVTSCFECNESRGDRPWRKWRPEAVRRVLNAIRRKLPPRGVPF